MTSNSPVCYANIPSGTSGRTHTERYSAVQPAGFGKIGMTIEEAADYMASSHMRNRLCVKSVLYEVGVIWNPILWKISWEHKWHFMI